MEVKAKAKNIRISPEKVGLVVKQIRKLKPVEAIEILDFVPKSSSLVLKKLIKSAIANGTNNLGLREESLVFKRITIGKGPTMKRWRAVARGRAHSILKRTSHIEVILEGEQQIKAAEEPKEKK